MKKTYQHPETTVVEMELQQIMAGSEIGMGGSYNGTDAIESRGGSAWDDEDYD